MGEEEHNANPLVWQGNVPPVEDIRGGEVVRVTEEGRGRELPL